MISFFFRSLALLTILSHTGFSAPYHRPNASKELFQLENIPLRVNTMREISKHLVVIACRKQDKSPEQQRASAQLLALAMRLDPINKKIRETDKALSKGKHPRDLNDDQVATATSTLRVYHEWLANPDAGKNANQLANLLIDATKTLDPQTLHQPDTADWSGVLPPLQAAPIQKPESELQKPEPDVTADPTPASKPAVTTPQFHLPELLARAAFTIELKEKYINPWAPDEPAYRYIEKKSILPIGLKIFASDTERDLDTLTIRFFPSLESEENTSEPPLADAPKKLTTSTKITYTLKTLLKSRHGTFPASDINVKLSQGRYALSNELAITAPLAIMLEASATNQPLRKDIHICAAINAKGELRQPKKFWEQFQLLIQSEHRGRLIVSEKSSKLIMQSLVFDDPEFLTRWEIFTAETLDQAMELATQSTPQHITDASKLFRTIQDLTPKSKVTQIAVNSAVRNRLSEILKLAPNHLSSKALLLQGSPDRPSRLSSVALAHELAPIVKRINKHLQPLTDGSTPTEDQLKKIHEKLRDLLDPLERLVDRTNDELYQETLKLANDFRRLATIARRNASDPYDSSILQLRTNLTSSMRADGKNLKGQIKKTLKGK